MTSPEGCDACHEERDLFALSNRETGAVQYLGPLCLAMFATTQLIVADTETADVALAAVGYQPSAATKKARKAGEEPAVDVTASIVDVVESEPRPPDADDEPTLAPTRGEELVDAVIARNHAEDDADAPPY